MVAIMSKRPLYAKSQRALEKEIALTIEAMARGVASLEKGLVTQSAVPLAALRDAYTMACTLTQHVGRLREQLKEYMVRQSLKE